MSIWPPDMKRLGTFRVSLGTRKPTSGFRFDGQVLGDPPEIVSGKVLCPFNWLIAHGMNTAMDKPLIARLKHD